MAQQAQGDRGAKRRTEQVASANAEVVEHRRGVGHQVLVAVAAQVGTVIACGGRCAGPAAAPATGQIVGDAAELPGQQGAQEEKRPPIVRQARDEQERRPTAPAEVGAAVPPGVADPLDRFALESAQRFC